MGFEETRRKGTMTKKIALLFVLFAALALGQTHSAALSWTTGAGNPAPPATTSNVYRLTGTCPSNPVWGTPLNTSPITGTTYTDLAVTATTEYCYTVTNVVAGVESAKMSPPVAATIPPSTPTNLSVAVQ
jgi:hypothetical protein